MFRQLNYKIARDGLVQVPIVLRGLTYWQIGAAILLWQE